MTRGPKTVKPALGSDSSKPDGMRKYVSDLVERPPLEIGGEPRDYIIDQTELKPQKVAVTGVPPSLSFILRKSIYRREKVAKHDYTQSGHSDGW